MADVTNLKPGQRLEAPDQDAARPEGTEGWRLNHTCYRIKDPKIAIPFYRDGLGLRLYFTFNAGPVTIYYLGYPPEGSDYVKPENVKVMQRREGLLELLHFKGTENDPDFKYAGGNLPPLGFSHIGITVPSVEDALTRLTTKFGAKVIKPLGTTDDPNLPQGHDPLPEGFANVIKKIAFVEDHDGYLIEIVPQNVHGK
ncbi:Glyoxalase/Bleomycin resistance protein/Dihydroxybiphenyl dioxygenase [Meredithblackwellia eburnea MCA 4105]